MRVVARRPEQAAIRRKRHGAAVMAALLALLVVLQQQLFRRQIERVALHREPRKILPVETRRRVEAVDPAVLGKLRIEREAEEAVLLILENLEFASHDDGARLRVVDLQLATVFVEKDAAIRREREAHRLRDALDQPLDLEAVIRRRLGRGRGMSERAERGGNGEGGGEFHAKTSGAI